MSKVHLKNAFHIARANFKQQDIETKQFQSTFSFFIVCTASRSISTANILSSPLLLMECDCYVEAVCLLKCRGKQLQLSLHFAIERSVSFIFDLHFANSGLICRQVICAEFRLQTNQSLVLKGCRVCFIKLTDIFIFRCKTVHSNGFI